MSNTLFVNTTLFYNATHVNLGDLKSSLLVSIHTPTTEIYLGNIFISNVFTNFSSEWMDEWMNEWMNGV